jgi:hypothetical protein
VEISAGTAAGARERLAFRVGLSPWTGILGARLRRPTYRIDSKIRERPALRALSHAALVLPAECMPWTIAAAMASIAFVHAPLVAASQFGASNRASTASSEA